MKGARILAAAGPTGSSVKTLEQTEQKFAGCPNVC